MSTTSDLQGRVHVSEADLKQWLALLHVRMTRLEAEFEMYKQNMKLWVDWQLQKLWEEIMSDSDGSESSDE